MRPDLAVLPPRFLRTKEAAEFLSLSARTLEKHRTYGTGPDYKKLGGRVVYAIDDLQAWAERGAVTSLVVLTLPGGGQITASVTNDAVAALDIKVGLPATAVFKAYAVMLAVAGE